METGQKSLAQLALEQKTPKYVTLEVASKLSGYTPDFLERLCRLRKVKYRLWNGDKHVVELDSLVNETHSIIPSFDGLDMIEESDTKEDPAMANTTLVGDIDTDPSGGMLPMDVVGADQAQHEGVPVSIPIAPQAPGSVRETPKVEPDRAEAMLGFSAVSRKRVGESRVGEFSFVGRPVLSDPDNPEAPSPDTIEVRIPVPIVQAAKEEEDRKAREQVAKKAELDEEARAQVAGAAVLAPLVEKIQEAPPAAPAVKDPVISAAAPIVAAPKPANKKAVLPPPPIAPRSFAPKTMRAAPIVKEKNIAPPPQVVNVVEKPPVSVPAPRESTPILRSEPEPVVAPTPAEPVVKASEVAAKEGAWSDPWDELLLGGNEDILASSGTSDAIEAEGRPVALVRDEEKAAPVETLPVAKEDEKVVEKPTPLPPVPDLPAVDTARTASPAPKVKEVTDVYTSVLPPRVDLNTVLSSVMPAAKEEAKQQVATPVAAQPASGTAHRGDPIQEEAKPLFPPLSRPAPLEVAHVDMVPKEPMVLPEPPKPALPPFPDLVPKPIQKEAQASAHPLPATRSDIHPARLEEHSLMKSAGFNAAAALVLILAAIGLALAKGPAIESPKSQTATVGSALEESRGPAQEEDITAHVTEAAFSDQIVVTPGTDENSVVITPIFDGGSGNSLEYVLIPREE